VLKEFGSMLEAGNDVPGSKAAPGSWVALAGILEFGDPGSLTPGRPVV